MKLRSRRTPGICGLALIMISLPALAEAQYVSVTPATVRRISPKITVYEFESRAGLKSTFSCAKYLGPSFTFGIGGDWEGTLTFLEDECCEVIELALLSASRKYPFVFDFDSTYRKGYLSLTSEIIRANHPGCMYLRVSPLYRS